jgi:hypothetical protein
MDYESARVLLEERRRKSGALTKSLESLGIDRESFSRPCQREFHFWLLPPYSTNRQSLCSSEKPCSGDSSACHLGSNINLSRNIFGQGVTW